MQWRLWYEDRCLYNGKFDIEKYQLNSLESGVASRLVNGTKIAMMPGTERLCNMAVVGPIASFGIEITQTSATEGGSDYT